MPLPPRDPCGLMHGDDNGFVVHDKHSKNIAAHMATNFKVKAATTGRSDRRELRVVNHIIKWAPGVQGESDHRHAGKSIEEAGLAPQLMVVPPVIRESKTARKANQEAANRSGELPTCGVGQPSAGSGTTLRAGPFVPVLDNLLWGGGEESTRRHRQPHRWPSDDDQRGRDAVQGDDENGTRVPTRWVLYDTSILRESAGHDRLARHEMTLGRAAPAETGRRCRACVNMYTHQPCAHDVT